MQESKAFFIGELSVQSGVSRATIRYYEGVGVLPEARRSGAGYRVYGREDLERLEFVVQAKELGLKLEDIGEALAIVDDGGEPCAHVRERMTARLEETRERIERLRALERRLDVALARSESAGDGGGVCRCRIIASMAEEDWEDDQARVPAPGAPS